MAKKAILSILLLCLLGSTSWAQAYFQEERPSTCQLPGMCLLVGQSGVLVATGIVSGDVGCITQLYGFSPQGQTLCLGKKRALGDSNTKCDLKKAQPTNGGDVHEH